MKSLKDSMAPLMGDRHFRVLESLTPEEYADTLLASRSLALQDHRLCPNCNGEVEIIGHEWTGGDGLIRFERDPVEALTILDADRHWPRTVKENDPGAVRRQREKEDAAGRKRRGEDYFVLVYEYHCPACEAVLTRMQTEAF